MGISDTLHWGRQYADRQQSSGARHQGFCNWQKKLVVQRHRRGSQGQCRRLQSDADLPRLTRRAICMVAPRPHRIAKGRGRRRYDRPAAIQLPQNRHSLTRQMLNRSGSPSSIPRASTCGENRAYYLSEPTDPENVDAAIMLLDIVTMNPNRDPKDYPRPQLLLQPWAVR